MPVGIEDLAPPGRLETVRLVRFDVEGREEIVEFGPLRGMTILEWTALLRRYPNAEEIAAAAAKSAASVGEKLDAVDMDALISVAVIAIGLGHPGNLEIERLIELRLDRDEMDRVRNVVTGLTKPEARRGPLPAGGAPSPTGRPAPRKAGKAPASASSSRSTRSSATGTAAPT